jgi:predicted metal-binding protein
MPRTTKNRGAGSGIERFKKRALELGAMKAKIIKAESIATAPWVRVRCQYGCPLYGKRLSCPPHSPTPEQTREIIDCFKTAVLVEGGIFKVTDLVAALEREIFLEGYYKAMSMGGGPCVKCESCALDEGCRHPIQARPSMEACGIDVYKTVRSNRWKIDVVKTHQSPNRHFGVVLVE